MPKHHYSNLSERTGIEHVVNGEKLLFQAVSADTIFAFGKLSEPFMRAIATSVSIYLASNKMNGKVEQTNNAADQSFFTETTIQAMQPETLAEQNRQLQEVASHISSVLAEKETRLFIAQAVIDSSWRNFFDKSEDRPEPSKFLKDVHGETFMEMVMGTLKANRNLAAPLVGSAARGELREAVAPLLAKIKSDLGIKAPTSTGPETSSTPSTETLSTSSDVDTTTIES